MTLIGETDILKMKAPNQREENIMGLIISIFVIAVVSMVIVYALSNMSKKGSSCCGCSAPAEKKEEKPAGKA